MHGPGRTGYVVVVLVSWRGQCVARFFVPSLRLCVFCFLFSFFVPFSVYPLGDTQRPLLATQEIGNDERVRSRERAW